MTFICLFIYLFYLWLPFGTNNAKTNYGCFTRLWQQGKIQYWFESYFFISCQNVTRCFQICLVNFRLFEEHTKFEKIFLMVLTNELIYLVNVKTIRKIFSNYVCFSESPNFESNLEQVLQSTNNLLLFFGLIDERMRPYYFFYENICTFNTFHQVW